MLFLHLSDIHFKEREINRSTDPNHGLRDDLIDDVRKMREKLKQDIDVILLSGDIAFAGKDAEYEFALTWLREKLCPASGCSFENIVVIPGNHDVDRSASNNPMERRARASLRTTPTHQSNASMTEFLNDRSSAGMLFRPIDSYNRFAANFLCEIGFEDNAIFKKPYVERPFTLNDGSVIQVWGFNSVLVCDADDAKDLMFVDPSAAQVIERDPGTAHLVMCHHPFGWLRNGAEFRERIEQVAAIHLFGHEHSLRVEQYSRFTRIRAGALQPERDEPGWKPGYNIIDVSVAGVEDQRRLNLKVWVRQRENARFIPIPDLDDNETWNSSHRLSAWTSPVTSVDTAVEPSDTEPSGTEQNEGMVMQSPTIRSVVPKMLALAERDQQTIISSLGLDQADDTNLRDYEAAMAAVRRAADRGQLGDLDQAIDKFNAARGA